MFDILLENKNFDENFQEIIFQAKIIINEFSEALHIPISYWNIADYISNWKYSLTKGFLNKKDSALLTTAYNLTETNFLQSWILYYSTETIYIQNYIFFLDEHKDLNLKNINDFIPPREIFTEEGERISEWKVRSTDILEFYESLDNKLNVISKNNFL
ncbi:hypothetical protein ACLS0M_05035 [Avibacterium avium]|uniref:hypothetical protein n=1 Tax=Avibacterium avium TaxID=751 RepID=UPI003BF83232